MKNLDDTKTTSSLKHVTILGVKINSALEDELLTAITGKIAKRAKFYIVTPNPEILVQAQNDKELSDSLNSADFSIPDGVGVTFASLFLEKKRLKPIRGRTFMLDLMEIANKYHLKVYLLGATKFSNDKAQRVLNQVFPDAVLNGQDGFFLDDTAKPKSEIDKKREVEVIKEINTFRPDILFIAFGAPRQEKWLNKWLPKLNIGGAMVVGGSFDYLSGVVKLPPEWISSIGFEWLWRLIQEPKRIKRMTNALLVFSFLVIKSKIGH